MSKNRKIFTFVKDPSYYVTSVRQLLVLAAAGREDIIDAVAVLGASTVPDIARYLGRTRNSLYYHVKVMRKAGLLVEGKVQRDGVKTTARYDLPGRPMIVKYDLSSLRSRRAVVSLGKRRFRAGERAFVRGCKRDDAVVEGPGRNLWVSHWKGWLSDDEVVEVNRLFHSLVDLYRRSSRTDGGREKPYAITFAIAPSISGSAQSTSGSRSTSGRSAR